MNNLVAGLSPSTFTLGYRLGIDELAGGNCGF